MSILSSNAVNEILVGNEAGWLLEFYREFFVGAAINKVLSISSDQYHAEINATLPGGLGGGTYTFTIEGLIDEHYRQITQSRRNYPTVVKLYLFWRDVNNNVGSYLANLAGITNLTSRLSRLSDSVLADALVAVLNIKSVSRKAGIHHYQTTIQAQEYAYSALARRLPEPIPNQSSAMTPAEVLQDIQLRTNIEIRADDAFEEDGSLPGTEGSADTADTRTWSFLRGSTYREEIEGLARALEQARNEYGRGMLLIRDGVLHVGPRQQLMGGNPKRLALRNGLIETESVGLVDSDPFFNPESSTEQPVQRQQFRLTLKGRPDLKPGDLVRFVPPPQDLEQTTPGLGSAMAGGFGAPLVPELEEDLYAITMYVTSVNHRLGRTRGFVSVVTGVEVNPDDLWDHWSPSGSRPQPSSTPEPAAVAEVEAAQAIGRTVQRALDTTRLTEVGEVRQVYTEGEGSRDQPPRQTLDVWQGLQPPDGRRNQAHRLPIQRENPHPLQGVAYATPFAWGRCGLVLPRYPGARIVMTYRNGQANDPIDIGALWEAGHGPDSQPGDWWLILPAGVDEDKRESIPEDPPEPEEYTGRVTQDLIDADGNRIIEVGELTIRIGRDSLRPVGERAERADEENSVTIEHADAGSKIVMKSDGTVVIEAAKNIELKAEEDINIEARNVNVRVSDAMDVSGRS